MPSNAAGLLHGVRERLGIDPEVLSGDEEARSRTTARCATFARRPAEPVLVIDIGGGSTELILGGRTPDRRALDGHRLGAAA